MPPSPTDRELEILKVLWDLGEGSVRDVHQRLAPQAELHFNTVQTQLRIMDEKGLVAHRQVGRSFLYKAQCSREQISSRFLQKVFDGALDQLVLCMLKTERVRESELQEIEHLIADARKRKQSRRRDSGNGP